MPNAQLTLAYLKTLFPCQWIHVSDMKLKSQQTGCLSSLQAIISDVVPKTPTCCYGINADTIVKLCDSGIHKIL